MNCCNHYLLFPKSLLYLVYHCTAVLPRTVCCKHQDTVVLLHCYCVTRTFRKLQTFRNLPTLLSTSCYYKLHSLTLYLCTKKPLQHPSNYRDIPSRSRDQPWLSRDMTTVLSLRNSMCVTLFASKLLQLHC